MLDTIITNPTESLTAFALCWIRLVVCFSVAPLFSPPQSPWSLKFALAACLAVPAFPLASLPHFGEQGLITEPGIFMAKEAVVGLLLGVMLAVPIWVAEGFGIHFDNQRGAMSGGTFNPLNASPSPIGALLQYAAVAALYETGGIQSVIECLVWSFQVWPVADTWPSRVSLEPALVVDAFNAAQQVTLLYFLPLLAMLVLVELGLAVISVYAPSLQAYQMAMPIKSYVGLLLLIVGAGIFSERWGEQSFDYFTTFYESMAKAGP